MNNNSSSSSNINSNNFLPSVNRVLACLFVLISIVGILGNILVIVSVRLDARMRRSLTNRLIVHVALCDLIILLFNIPDIIQFVLSIDSNWILNEYACKLIRSILVLAQYASVLTMCAVTIERFIGIVYPLRSKFLRERKHVTLITLAVWFFSLVCASPNLVYLRLIIENSSSSHRSCRLLYSEDNFINYQIYMIHKSMEFLLFYFIPLLLQLYCYAKIARRLVHIDERLVNSFRMVGKPMLNRPKDDVDDEDDYMDDDENTGTKMTVIDSATHSPISRSHQRTSNLSFHKVLTVDQNDSSPISHHHQFKTSYSTRRSTVAYKALKSRRSVVKMLAVVVLIYFVSFSPQVFVFILFDTQIIRSVPKFIRTSFFRASTMLLVFLSTASNPIVYAIFCSKFRQSFAKILRRLWCCGRSSCRCNFHQRSTSLRQIPRATYRFGSRMTTGEKRPTMNNGTGTHFRGDESERQ